MKVGMKVPMRRRMKFSIDQQDRRAAAWCNNACAFLPDNGLLPVAS
jgi:hypothetical protein